MATLTPCTSLIRSAERASGRTSPASCARASRASADWRIMAPQEEKSSESLSGVASMAEVRLRLVLLNWTSDRSQAVSAWPGGAVASSSPARAHSPST